MATNGWACPACTFINFPSRPGCEICSEERPADYHLPDYTPSQMEVQWLERQKKSDESFQKFQNGEIGHSDQSESSDSDHQDDCTASPYGNVHSTDWLEVIKMDREPLTRNEEAAECPLCFDLVHINDGIKLKECFHICCQSCLQNHIENSLDPIVQCPQCPTVLQEREIRALVGTDGLNRLHARCMIKAEKGSPESTFHCRTVDCNGWCFYDENVNRFKCPVCQKNNCITCRAQHSEDCMTYQKNLAHRASNNDDEAIKTQNYLQRLIMEDEAMHCPDCTIILSKKDGCDWIRCPVCHLEICYVTKGRRWGPLGSGDISGGCQCRLFGPKCHPKCVNCH